MMKSLAVFCGSRKGVNPVFAEHAAFLGKQMGLHGITLVYGGGNVGLMKVLSDSVMKHNGKVIGVIPEMLIDLEKQHTGITELKVVADMHTRKKTMYELCDAAVILPGGFGSLDEFFEMLTWNQLNIHNKQILLLNSDGYFNYLIKHIQIMEAEKFLYEKAEERIRICSHPSQVLDYMLLH